MNTRTTRYLASTLLAVTALTAQTCRADCFDTAAQAQNVSPVVLHGIAVVESQNNPHAIHRNKNHTVDYGILQINSIHLKELRKYGVHRADLLNKCTNIYTGARILRGKMDKYGNTWAAVGAYHSETPRERWKYARKVRLVVQELEYEHVIQLASAQ
jgi:soluble lytic murein transglycosylase-like protein